MSVVCVGGVGFIQYQFLAVRRETGGRLKYAYYVIKG